MINHVGSFEVLRILLIFSAVFMPCRRWWSDSRCRCLLSVDLDVAYPNSPQRPSDRDGDGRRLRVATYTRIDDQEDSSSNATDLRSGSHPSLLLHYHTKGVSYNGKPNTSLTLSSSPAQSSQSHSSPLHNPTSLPHPPPPSPRQAPKPSSPSPQECHSAAVW